MLKQYVCAHSVRGETTEDAIKLFAYELALKEYFYSYHISITCIDISHQSFCLSLCVTSEMGSSFPNSDHDS